MIALTPEIILKRQETRRRNQEERKRQDAEDIALGAGLRTEIGYLQKLQVRRDSLRDMQVMTVASMALTGDTLLSEEEIVAGCKPYQLCSGVYFLVNQGKVVYVGQSINIFSRISNHKDKSFDSFGYVLCEPENLDKLESLYIHWLKPPLNGDSGFGGYKNAPLRLIDVIGDGTNQSARAKRARRNGQSL